MTRKGCLPRAVSCKAFYVSISAFLLISPLTILVAETNYVAAVGIINACNWYWKLDFKSVQNLSITYVFLSEGNCTKRRKDVFHGMPRRMNAGNFCSRLERVGTLEMAGRRNKSGSNFPRLDPLNSSSIAQINYQTEKILSRSWIIPCDASQIKLPTWRDAIWTLSRVTAQMLDIVNRVQILWTDLQHWSEIITMDI